MKNKILFILDRYNYNDNEILIAENLAILLNLKLKSFILQVILRKKSFFQLVYNDDLNFTIDLNIFNEITNKKRFISTSRDIR